MANTKIYRNTKKERQFTRNTVPQGYEAGPPVIYTVPEGKYLSADGQAAADALAEADIQANGQAYANRFGAVRVKMFYSEEMTKLFSKNDCDTGSGYDLAYTAREGMFISYLSQEDANAKAESYLNIEGQKYANEYGKCCKEYKSRARSDIFYKEDCPAGTACKDGVEYHISAGLITSFIDQQDADMQAYKILQEKGQEHANQNGVCVSVYYNDEQKGWFTRKCKEGYKAQSKIYTVGAGEISSFISKDDANKRAKKILQDFGEQYARMTTKCEPINPEENVW